MELLPAVYALRKAPTRSGAHDSISRGGKGVKKPTKVKKVSLIVIHSTGLHRLCIRYVRYLVSGVSLRLSRSVRECSAA